MATSFDVRLKAINVKAKQLRHAATQSKGILGGAVSVIARDATHYHDLVSVLREFLRQRDYWVAEKNSGVWVVLHMALRDDHPAKGSRLGDPVQFQTEAEAYRYALEQATGQGEGNDENV